MKKVHQNINPVVNSGFPDRSAAPASSSLITSDTSFHGKGEGLNKLKPPGDKSACLWFNSQHHRKISVFICEIDNPYTIIILTVKCLSRELLHWKSALNIRMNHAA